MRKEASEKGGVRSRSAWVPRLGFGRPAGPRSPKLAARLGGVRPQAGHERRRFLTSSQEQWLCRNGRKTRFSTNTCMSIPNELVNEADAERRRAQEGVERPSRSLGRARRPRPRPAPRSGGAARGQRKRASERWAR